MESLVADFAHISYAIGKFFVFRKETETHWFPKILSFKLFDHSWGNFYNQPPFPVIHFTFAEQRLW